MTMKHKIRPDVEAFFHEVADSITAARKTLPTAKSKKVKGMIIGFIQANTVTLKRLGALLRKLETMEKEAEKKYLEQHGGVMPASVGPLIQVVGGFRDKQ
jgi:hypothetical protein